MCKMQVEVNGRAKLLHRNYHDLLWLHRNLTRMVDIGGYVVSTPASLLCGEYPCLTALCNRKWCGPGNEAKCLPRCSATLQLPPMPALPPKSLNPKTQILGELL